MHQEQAAPNLAAAVISVSLHCRSCGYDLRGLRADGRCPECGAEIWQSVLHAVDPAASRLPKLRRPGAVGNALVWIMGCIFLAGVLLACHTAQVRMVGATQPVQIGTLRLDPGLLWVLAGTLGLAALVGFWRLSHPQAEEPGRAIGQDLRLMAVGLAGWSGIVLLRGVLALVPLHLGGSTMTSLVLVGDLTAIIGLMGMRGVLLAIGLRSREYRNARGARQGATSMIAAVLIDALGRIIMLLQPARGPGGDAFAVAEVVVATSNLMLLIGLAYLLINAWWIRRSLRQPLPRLDQVLQIPRAFTEAPTKHASS